MFSRLLPSVRARVVVALSMLMILLPLVGCYEVYREVIPAEMGDVLPYRASSAKLQKGGTLYVSPTGDHNDYSYREEGSEHPSKGTFRLLHIKDDLYAVQARQSTGERGIVFYRIAANTFGSVDFASLPDAKALATRYKVNLDFDSMTGEPANILAFLRACGSLEFKTI